ncbi:hypothetical protein LRS74_05965 [Streptomyces sp. LX-29]|uniref:hypothetical protein n=1 Tax=Streptomyces sp. LX-29 TaxID=2900152 RepID=UPI00240E159C|nr:hypothetical protein [Streptomyces sp. LX-29]WFB06637.1 hypothetical protein LRS74_05965 [Streptomyces sp. LX-29]
MTTEPEQTVAAAELAELRRSVDVTHARVEGQLALLAHRGDEAAADLAQLTARVRVLEHSRWPLPSIAALTGVCALLLALWQAAGR